MTKTELVDRIADKTGLTKKDTKETVDAFTEVVTETLQEEANKDEDERDKVQLIGFGSFEVRDRSARKGRNPQTGEEIEIPARKVPAFKAGKGLKEAVDQ
ncbi:HU family DNA-binding protein [Acetohalobium arabaticum]|uniref:Bacterial nucleoid protein Hbs n=1 Tax=Acetohalobium arabaticum (strain ATCC 49924 / DSM 5501 / Z-7288) TaxID=574087 RepID=D9QQ01_ACEAZ|nr:HU family DNA-binding protein [Acetohalobium arabaticum]ADL12592.1 bacterial nucleoid protein Hbs [Acetohalobium arabaticum DSM 5501]